MGAYPFCDRESGLSEPGSLVAFPGRISRLIQAPVSVARETFHLKV